MEELIWRAAPAVLCAGLLKVYADMVAGYVAGLSIRKQPIGWPNVQGVTLIVCLRNEAANAERLCEALLRQHRPRTLTKNYQAIVEGMAGTDVPAPAPDEQDYSAIDVQIVLVDDHSTDGTYELLVDISRANNHAFTVCRNTGAPGKKHALAFAMRYVAAGEAIVCTDADCLPTDPGWLSEMALYLGAYQADLVLGPVDIAAAPHAFWQQCQRVEFAAVMATTQATAHQGNPLMANGACLAFTRSLYERAEALRTDMGIPSGDDMFLLQATKKLGGGIAWCPTGVETRPAPTLAAFIRQRMRWAGKWTSYPDSSTQRIAMLTFLAQAARLAALALLWVRWQWLLAGQADVLSAVITCGLTYYLFKLGQTEWVLISRYLGQRGQKTPILPFLFWQIVYAPYVLAVALAGTFAHLAHLARQARQRRYARSN